MSSLTAAALTKLRDAEGNLIWRESLIVGQPATLLGRPVEIDNGTRRHCSPSRAKPIFQIASKLGFQCC